MPCDILIVKQHTFVIVRRVNYRHNRDVGHVLTTGASDIIIIIRIGYHEDS
jgi:hypothetical protein